MLKLAAYLSIILTAYLFLNLVADAIISKDLLRAILAIFAGVVVVVFLIFELKEELRLRSKK